jgi:uncharacterized protein
MAARSLRSRRNRLIDSFLTLRFIRQAKRVEARKEQAQRLKVPQVFKAWDLDELYTAKMAGFKSRSEYYSAYSSKKFLATLTVPATILAAADDPVIPAAMFTRGIPDNVELRLEKHGGHVAFVGWGRNEFGDHRWIDSFVLDWVSKF